MTSEGRRHASAGPSGRRALVVLSETYADGGIQRFNRTFLAACGALGLQCDVLSLGDAPDARARWAAPPSANIAVFDHNKERFALETASKIARGGYGLIIVGHINLLTLVAAAANLQYRARILLIAHGIEVWSGLTGLRRRALSSVDSVLCVSRYTQRAMQQQAPEVPDERFIIFPNALSESWREQFNWVSTLPPATLPTRFLLSVTRLDRADRYKGLITVLESLSMIEDQSVRYVVAGRGNDAHFIERVVARLGLTARVDFVGAVSDSELAALYRNCTAFVLPSGKEGFGIVFLEAMFFGACVIAAREKGAVDVVQHEETGFLVPYGDVVALKDAIDRVLGDSALRERICAAGRATVSGDGPFTFRSYVSRLGGALRLPIPAIGHLPESLRLPISAADRDIGSLTSASKLASQPDGRCA